MIMPLFRRTLMILTSGILLSACAPAGTIVSESWGETDGQPIFLYTMTNGSGLTAKVTNYGTLLTEMHAPDRHGQTADVVLGFDHLARYLQGHPAFGSNVGRVANRIAGGVFALDDKTITLEKNAGAHHIHGGRNGFHKRVWNVEMKRTPDGPAIRFSRRSPSGEEGYPGNLDVAITYSLSMRNELIIDFEATTDQPTLVNLAHHSYWNLAGHGAGSVLDHELKIEADRYMPHDGAGLPTGAILPVDGTPLDFRHSKKIGADMARLAPLDGYDHNFVVRGATDTLRPVAEVYEPTSGRVMTIQSTQPGVQLYTANGLNAKQSGKGATYGPHGALCLETQHFPDAIHHEGDPNWPSVILRPGAIYKHRMVMRFSTR